MHLKVIVKDFLCEMMTNAYYAQAMVKLNTFIKTTGKANFILNQGCLLIHIITEEPCV